jgi:hypothetical protein
MERLDHKLDCKKCGTIYPDIPDDVKGTSLIHCSSCGEHLGYWASYPEISTAKAASMAYSN